MEKRCCECNRLFKNDEWVHEEPDPEKYETTTHGFCDFCIDDVHMRAFGKYKNRYSKEWWDRINNIVDEIKNSQN